MINLHHWKSFARIAGIALLASASGLGPGKLLAAAEKARFASPDEAMKAFQAAVEARDKAAYHKIFGPEFQELLTGDEVQDKNNMQRFAMAVAQGCKPVKEGETKIIFELGTNNWPMPIPLVMADGQWHFDTVAGKEEIVNRHIGEGELNAIGVCRAYVAAQRQHAGMNTNANGEPKYAQKFKSSSGKKDGLYWPSAGIEPASPFGPLVAEAHDEGYDIKGGKGRQAFHGYYFRILTRQGKDAPGGKMDYVSHGNLTRGFALVAYPEHWDKSGIMTFIVNQDGKVYQQNFAEKTARIAGAMKEYNPDSDWKLETDEGELKAVLETEEGGHP